MPKKSRRQAEAVDAGAVADAADPLRDLPAHLVKRVAKYRFCTGVCQRPKERSHPRQAPESSACRSAEQRLLSPEEKSTLIHQWMLEEAGGRDGRLAVVAQVRTELLQQEAHRRDADGAGGSGGDEFRFDFGKYRGKCLPWVREVAPDYVSRIIAYKNFFTPSLRHALESDGTLDKEIEKATLFQKDAAERVVAKGPPAHPEPQRGEGKVRRSAREKERLDAIVLRKAQAVLASATDIIPPAGTPPRKQKVVSTRTREGASRQKLQLKNCLKCGSVGGHYTRTCPLVASAMVPSGSDQRAIAVAQRRDRLQISLRAHLLYVRSEQRSLQYDTRPTQRKRAAREVGGKAMTRMSALGLHAHLLDIRLLQDLEHSPCPWLTAGKCVSRGYGTRSILGCVVAPTNPSSQDIYKWTLAHR